MAQTLESLLVERKIPHHWKASFTYEVTIGLEVLHSSKLGVNPIDKYVFDPKGDKKEIHQWQARNIKDNFQIDKGNLKVKSNLAKHKNKK